MMVLNAVRQLPQEVDPLVHDVCAVDVRGKYISRSNGITIELWNIVSSLDTNTLNAPERSNRATPLDM